MAEEYEISLDLNNLTVILVLIGVPMWAWGAWARKRYVGNTRVQWIMRVGLTLLAVALIWIIVDLVTGRLLTIS